MRRISIAKTVILLFLIPFCLYLLYKIHSSWTSRPSQENSEINQEGTGIARVEQFEMKGLEMDGEAFTLKANEFSRLEEGASLLEKIDPLILTTSQGKKISLSGERGILVEGKEENKKIMIEGDVVVETEDGQKLITEKLTYETSTRKAVSDGKVQFSGPGFRGSASQLQYNLNQEFVKLAPHFDLTLERDGSDIRIQAAYFEGSLNLKEGLLQGGVIIQDEGNEILSQEARLIGDRKSGQWKEIQLVGSVQGKINQGVKDQKVRRTTFLAQKAFIFFNEMKELDQVILKDDITVFLGEENSSSENDKKLHCDMLTGSWNEGKITQIKAEGDVQMETISQKHQDSDSLETLSCQALLITFDQDGAVNQAMAFQDIMLQSGAAKGTCQEAEYDPEKKQVIMMQKVEEPPHLSVDVWSVQAREIIIKGREEISATGNVKTLYRERSSRDGQIPLFQKGKSVFVSSETLDVLKGEEAVYSGDVRAWQEENSIEAQKIHILFKKNVFEAHGDVISRFTQDSFKDSDEKKEDFHTSREIHPRIEVQSDRLYYSGELRKASYSGDVSLLMKESRMICSEMDILFSEEGQAEEIRAHSDIEIESKGFEATGESLEYFIPERTGTIYGTYTPARIYSKSGKEMAVGSFLTFHMLEDTISLLSRDEGRAWMIFK